MQTLPTLPASPQAHHLHLPFPHDITLQLDGADLRILEEMNFLSRLQAKKSRTGAKYCTPGEEYLGEKVGLSRSRVSDHICKLEKLGLLQVQRRRPINGRWQTNLYKIINWCWWRMAAILRKTTGKKRRRAAAETPRNPSPCAPGSTHSYPVKENISLEGASTSSAGTFSPLREALAQYFPRYKPPA